ncbi:hypothetical protein TSUD_372620 [Trifolium subterraneum]|nr:hypothetical protein TSUD_372620 [Trifolium subterraneum]
MIVEEEGMKKVKWNWRRLFQCEMELVDICNGVVFGADRSNNGQNRWKWSEDHYTVKKEYDLLTREETEDCEWVKDVWNPLIPSKMSMLGWRLFQSRRNNCPTLSVVWREVIKWLRIPVVLPEGGFNHLLLFMGLGNRGFKTKEKLGVIWFVAVNTIWRSVEFLINSYKVFADYVAGAEIPRCQIVQTVSDICLLVYRISSEGNCPGVAW